MNARAAVALYAVAVLLACACVVGGVFAYHEHQKRQDVVANPSVQPPSTEDQDRYGEVEKAADATAMAMLNIDYRKPEASTQAVSSTSTGTFLKQYQAATKSLVQLITQYKSVLTSTVVSTAVSDVDADSATVLVATSGKVSNAQTGDQPMGRNFRLVLSLVLVDGAWRTNNLEFAA